MVHNLNSFKYKISAFIISCLLFSLMINALLNYFNFQKTFTSLRRSNFVTVAEDIVNIIHFSLDMGLKPEEMNNIQDVLNTVVLNNTEVQYISLVDNKGETLYAAGEGGYDSGEAVKVFQQSRETLEKKRLIATPVFNSFKVNVGSLLLKYKDYPGIDPVHEMGYFLLRNMVIIAVISFLIILVAVSRIFSDLVSQFIRMNQSIRDNDASLWADEISGKEISAELKDFKKASGKVLKELEAIRKDIKRENHGN